MENTKKLVQFLQNKIDLKVQKLVSSKIIELLELKNEDPQNYENNLLRMAYYETDWFDLVIMNTIFEQFYAVGLINQDLACFKNIPNGSNYNYGNFFEKKVKDFLSEIEGVKISKKGTTDGIITFNSKQYILEVKCSKTDTKAQITKYINQTGINDFITVNGHENNIDLTFFTFVRCVESNLKDTFNLAIEIAKIREDNISQSC